MKEQFIAKTWVVGGAYVVNIPKQLVRLFKIKKGLHYRITIETIEEK